MGNDEQELMKRQRGLTLWFDAEMFEALNKYRISMGWTWNRFFLFGVASTIAKDSQDSELLVDIANYLEKRR